MLYVLVDDLRTQMGAYGHEFMKTPNLDTFAESAVVFEQAHCNSQMCVPTRTFFASFPSLRPACTDGGVDNHTRAHRLVCVCGALLHIAQTVEHPLIFSKVLASAVAHARLLLCACIHAQCMVHSVNATPHHPCRHKATLSCRDGGQTSHACSTIILVRCATTLQNTMRNLQRTLNQLRMTPITPASHLDHPLSLICFCSITSFLSAFNRTQCHGTSSTHQAFPPH